MRYTPNAAYPAPRSIPPLKGVTEMIDVRGRWRPALAVLSAAALLMTGCAKSEDDPAAKTTADSSAAAQATKSAGASGSTCTLQQFGGTKIDLKTATIGFSQSEKEANPFRIAETQSIKDEAAKLGIPAANLKMTNADSKFDKQITDVSTLIDQGVQLLVIAPLNSDGWDSVFQKAAAKKVPIVTIDRKINAKHCTDFLTFIGSDFADQRPPGRDPCRDEVLGVVDLASVVGACVVDDRLRAHCRCRRPEVALRQIAVGDGCGEGGRRPSRCRLRPVEGTGRGTHRPLVASDELGEAPHFGAQVVELGAVAVGVGVVQRVALDLDGVQPVVDLGGLGVGLLGFGTCRDERVASLPFVAGDAVAAALG